MRFIHSFPPLFPSVILCSHFQSNKRPAMPGLISLMSGEVTSQGGGSMDQAHPIRFSVAKSEAASTQSLVSGPLSSPMPVLETLCVCVTPVHSFPSTPPLVTQVKAYQATISQHQRATASASGMESVGGTEEIEVIAKAGQVRRGGEAGGLSRGKYVLKRGSNSSSSIS